MPLVRISIPTAKSESYRVQINKQIYDATREILQIPEGDRFHVITEHNSGTVIADPGFMGMKRTGDFVLIQIFLSRGRTTEIKQALYRNIVDRLAESPGIRPDDVMIVLTEVGLEDWSFGRGEAQYVLNPPAWAKKESVPA